MPSVLAVTGSSLPEQGQHFCNFIGQSQHMLQLYKNISAVAPSRAPVFIFGESGTGKELAADAIHRKSPRSQHALIPINCASIPHDLIESELFGHVKGAYTGAYTDRSGAFLEADKGTLFLDEVAELDKQTQAKLLRVLQTGEVRRVGESRCRFVDVRVLSATHRDVHALVRSGEFRQDLFYRLHVVPLVIPPLRDRGQDILLIAQHMLQQFAREDGRCFREFSSQAKAFLLAHVWPGNVRELMNTIRAAVALNDGVTMQLEMLCGGLHGGQVPLDDHFVQAATPRLDPQVGPIQTLAKLERDAIAAALHSFGGNVTHAAKALGVNPSTIHRKMTSYAQTVIPQDHFLHPSRVHAT